MESMIAESTLQNEKAEPLCPVFGACGGCAHQDLTYEAELRLKERKLREILSGKLSLPGEVFEPMTPSPKPYHYRNRLDLTMKRTKGQLAFGFSSPVHRRVIPVEACAIALPAISERMPELRREAEARMPADYLTANIVVRSGDDGKVFWGGIGRRSLEMKEENYFWTEIDGKKIFYSLETFFQANLSILPAVMERIKTLAAFDKETLFLDLYSGAGLFGIYFSDLAGKVIMVEDCPGSVKLAKYNIAYHQLKHVEIRGAKVESELDVIRNSGHEKVIAIVDPPRQGLSSVVCEAIAGAKYLESLFYLSCHPESLARDLFVFQSRGWKIQKVMPFDFFPKTSHLETLVLLRP